jgi:hypothetical protein
MDAELSVTHAGDVPGQLVAILQHDFVSHRQPAENSEHTDSRNNKPVHLSPTCDSKNPPIAQ